MENTALIIIDVQEAFNERLALGHQRNNPDAEANIARLLAGCRQAHLPIFHIRHASTEANSLFRPERSGFAVQKFAREQGGEAVIVKNVNSSFIGTRLEEDLRASGLTRLVICGATTNHCVETTTRMAGNLGFDALLVQDACWAFDHIGYNGVAHKAGDIHAMTLSNLDGEFATVINTDDILPRLAGEA